MLDARRLRVLREVLDAGSVTAAAQRLSYAPSAVSQHLAALERETGVTLFERAGRGIRPTPAAEVLGRHARDVLARLQEAEDAVAALRAGHTGRLSLAAFPTAGAGLVPTALREFRSRRPGVAVAVSIVEEDDALHAVRAGHVDVALVVREAVTTPIDDLVTVPLVEDPFRVVLGRTHPLASRRSIALAELADEAWVTASRTSTLCDRLAREACRSAGFEPRPAVEADDYAAAQAYVAAGLGVALVPGMALAAVHDGVVVRRVRGEEPTRTVVAVVRETVAPSGAVPVMLTALQRAARDGRRR